MIVCDRCGKEADTRVLRVLAECDDSPKTIPGTERQCLYPRSVDVCKACFDLLVQCVTRFMEQRFGKAAK